mmetsp:Transcript_34073/g.96577  ORF Transcript_34073/g.96577 Transcript_34073/m.96577 type:complete len:585 (-) Transcript_34073:1363-3117(-)
MIILRGSRRRPRSDAPSVCLERASRLENAVALAVVAVLWLFFATASVSGRALMQERWDLSDLASINQADTRKGPILPYDILRNMQKFADENGGSTVRRFPQQEADERLFAYRDPSTPGLVNATYVIRESARKTRSHHASAIAEVTPGVMLAAWFAGTYERMGDVGIYTSRYEHGVWSAPRQVAWPKLNKDNGLWEPCWNPVILHVPAVKTTLLFYKVGVDVGSWKSYVRRSYDGGLTWDVATRMSDNLIGPARNPPFITEGGIILSPSSDESHGWSSHVEISYDNGLHWDRRPDLQYKRGIIQPSIFQTLDGKLWGMFRHHEAGHAAQCYSMDGGHTWEPVVQSPIRSPNSGLCAIVLFDGRVAVIHNEGEGRVTMVLSMSYDHGATYPTEIVLEDAKGLTYERQHECHRDTLSHQFDAPELSYPTLIQSSDGMLHITYTYSYYGAGGRCSGRENIKHIILDPCKLPGARHAPCPCTTPGTKLAKSTDACRRAARQSHGKDAGSVRSPFVAFTDGPLTTEALGDFLDSLKFSPQAGLSVTETISGVSPPAHDTSETSSEMTDQHKTIVTTSVDGVYIHIPEGQL